MRSIFLHYLTLWPPAGYLFIFFGLAVEGDAVLFATAFLTQLGYFSPQWSLAATLAGVFIGDYLWYSLGRNIASAPTLIRRWMEHVTAPFDDHITARPFRTIFVTKFAYGIHHAVLVRAGSLGLSLDRLLRYDIVASAVWILVIGGLGYFSGASFARIHHYLRSAEIALVLALVIFVTLQHYWTKLSKHEL